MRVSDLLKKIVKVFTSNDFIKYNLVKLFQA